MSSNGFVLVIHGTDEHQGLLRHQKIATPPKRHWLPPCAENPGEGKEEGKKIKEVKRISNFRKHIRVYKKENGGRNNGICGFFFFSLSLTVECSTNRKHPSYYLLPPERTALGQPRLPSRRLAQHWCTGVTEDDCLGVWEDCRDVEAPRAFDVHEEGPGSGHKRLGSEFSAVSMASSRGHCWGDTVPSSCAS